MQEQADIAISCKNNPKRFWSFIKSKTDYKCSIGDLKYQNDNKEIITVTEDKDKADALVNFFSSVFTKEDTDEFEDVVGCQCTEKMEVFKIKESKILKKLNDLKIDKSPGGDGLHPRMLFEVRTEIVSPLKIIFERSFDLGCLPQEWKMGVVTAIYKKGNKTEMGNYRPVSLTSIICKVLESLIRDHIMEYLCTNNLINKRQYGFMKGRSTSLQLLHMLDRWTKFLESGGQVDAIYTDFEKAFDKVPHRRLIKKLQAIGIELGLIKWISAFLTNRKHCVRVNGISSDWMDVISGIPQGTILGPLLFLIYINDLPNICTDETDLYLFADDAKLFKFVKSASDQTLLQNKFCDFESWSRKWLLKLNVKKCKVISFCRTKDHFLSYNYMVSENLTPTALERVNNIVDLGVNIDDELKFTKHIHDKIHKAFSMLGVIKRNFKYLTQETFVLLYKNMVRSHLDYCNSVWSPSRPHDTRIDEIERVQRRATKLIQGLSKLNYCERLKRCGLPTLKYRRIRGDMIETYKIMSGVYDINVSPILELNLDRRTRGNCMKLAVNRTKYDLRKHFFTNRIVNIWNSLPDKIVKSTSVNQFKGALDRFWCNQEVLYYYKADLTGIGNRN